MIIYSNFDDLILIMVNYSNFEDLILSMIIVCTANKKVHSLMVENMGHL